MTRYQIIRLFIHFLLPIAFLSCSKQDTEESVYDTSKSLILREIAYGNAPREKMNIFLPAGRNSDTRVIIIIHGGGWNSGDKNDFDTFAFNFMNAGIAAVTVNYRYADISSDVNYISQLDDIEMSIGCLADSSVKYSINTSHICLLGHSAGGHLALLYTYRNNEKGRVDKVVSLAGPTDLTDNQFLAITGIGDLVNGLTGNDPAKRPDASPLQYASTITTYLYHGKADAVVPYQQSEKLFEKIRSKNPENYCSLIDNCGHGFNLYEFSRIGGETIDLVKNK